MSITFPKFFGDHDLGFNSLPSSSSSSSLSSSSSFSSSSFPSLPSSSFFSSSPSSYSNSDDFQILSTITSPSESHFPLTPKPSPYDPLNFSWDIKLTMVMTLFLLGIGVVGNILILLVMRRKPFLSSSACIYLPCMALCDTIFIISGITHEWTSWFKIDYPVWPCRIYRFINFTFGDMSIWILVAFTLDRFVAVCFPFRKKFFCHPKKALITVGIIFLLGIFKNSHLFWTRGANKKVTCGKVDKFRFFEDQVRPWMALVFVTLLPFFSILFFNISIVRQLLKSKNTRPKSFAGGHVIRSSITNSQSVVVPKIVLNEKKRSDKSFYQTTAMCLSVSFAFLIFTFPSFFTQLGKPYWKKQAWFGPVKNINVLLSFLNHSVNFYLYCLTGVRFRVELMSLFGRKKQHYSISSGLDPKGGSVGLTDLKNTTEYTNKNSVIANPVIALAFKS